jgi:6-phosphofructokinase 1
MSKKNVIVGQSGGPTAVINSSLYGIVFEAMEHPGEIDKTYGMVNGIEGFLKGEYLDFAQALPGGNLEFLKSTPGAYLGSCRYKLPDDLSGWKRLTTLVLSGCPIPETEMKRIRAALPDVAMLF